MPKITMNEFRKFCVIKNMNLGHSIKKKIMVDQNIILALIDNKLHKLI